MNVSEVKESEKQSAIFTELPDPHLFVKTQLIMDVGNSDLTNADQVRTVIKDIWDIRQSKLRKVVDTFVQSGAARATLNNVQTIELNSIRPLLTHTLDQIYRLEMSLAEATRNAAASQGSQMNGSFFNNSLY